MASPDADVASIADPGASDAPVPPSTAPPGEEGAAASDAAAPVLARGLTAAREAASTVATAFNERVIPGTTAVASEARAGWNQRVLPGLAAGGATVTRFFGSVVERAKETNERLRQENDTFRAVGDGISLRAKTTMDTLQEGTRELRIGVAELVAGGAGSAAAVADADRRDRSTSLPLDRTESPGAGPAAAPIPDHPGAVLGVPLETLAAHDARVAPIPHALLAMCHWLCAAADALDDDAAADAAAAAFGDDIGRSEEEDAAEDVSAASRAILDEFAEDPLAMIPADARFEDVAGAVAAMLGHLPEPLFGFSLYAAVVKSGGSADAADVSYVAELAQLLPPARRGALECVLGACARVAFAGPAFRAAAENAEEEKGRREKARRRAERTAAALAPRAAWPRSGKPEAADVRAAFGRGETGGDPRLEKIAEELGAVTNALAHLIVERGRGPRA